MGEITDMILDGTLCQVCGTLVCCGDPNVASRSELSPGFPRTCPDCIEEEKRDSEREPCPDCEDGKLHDASGGGIKCDKCDYWFCF